MIILHGMKYPDGQGFEKGGVFLASQQCCMCLGSVWDTKAKGFSAPECRADKIHSVNNLLRDVTGRLDSWTEIDSNIKWAGLGARESPTCFFQ